MMRRLALAVLVAMLPALAPAQDRGKPIRVIVATGVGGTADVFMRVLGDIIAATAGPS
jgi:tripartite-type tricarboxylate transporter receptor subunit TctC